MAGSKSPGVLPLVISVRQEDLVASDDISQPSPQRNLRTYDHRYSDFTFRCRDYAWPVHRHILVQKSQFFERICSGEHHLQLGSSGLPPREWDFQNAHPRAVECIISWFYHGDYDDSKPSEHKVLDYTVKLGIHLAFAARCHGLHVLSAEARRRTACHLRRMSKDGTFFEVLSIMQKNGPSEWSPEHYIRNGRQVLELLDAVGDEPFSNEDAERLMIKLCSLYANDARDLIGTLSYVRWMWESIDY